jgi:hypothetical protein
LLAQGRRLAGRISNRGDVRCVVDHDRVVDIREDYVVRRWRDERRRLTPKRNRYKDRNWQYEERDGQWWRGQIDEFRQWWRQKENRQRRRGWERVDRIVEDENRLIQIDGLFRRWRRHIVIDEGERRRRLLRRGKIGQSTARVRRVWSVQITA